MSDHTLQDRQDAPIWNAIEANNFKQALKLVDKRLSKKPTDHLEALKVFIRSKSPLVAEKSAVLLHLEELAEKKKALQDLETVELYDEAFEEVLPGSQESWGRIIGELRWQCVKAHPKNEDLSLKCFQACLGKDDLEHSKQISNSLEKAFPKSHPYVFWNIATMFLYSISNHYPENQRKLWGSLSFAQIGKLATATKEASDPKQLSIRSIQTPQELLLLHRITEALGKPEQRLGYLNDATLGPESAAAKGEWQLWRFKLQLTESTKKWQELFDTSKALLRRARTADESGQLSEAGMSDWIVWEAFIRSAVELQGQEYKDVVMAEVEAHLDPACKIDKSWKRNASLALVKITFESSSPFQGQAHDRIPVIVKYLEKYGNASTAYNDLRPFVERLSTDDKKKLLDLLLKNTVFGEIEEHQDFKTAKKVTELINTFKLRYLLTSSLPEYEVRESPMYKSGKADLSGLYSESSLAQLAQDSTRLYLSASDGGRTAWDLLPTDTHPADDLCLLSAMCLIKLAMPEKDSSEPLAGLKVSYILQATALLEYALTHSKPNFQMSLLLTRLYYYLGCGSMAMHAYQRLGLKQIQLDTLSYVLMDRISTFHPHPFTHTISESPPCRSPIESFQKQQKMYRSARGQISKNIWLSFKNSSYNSIFEIKEVSDTLSRTLSAAMSVTEILKISRLIPSKTASDSSDGGYDVIPSDREEPGSPYSDTNDYETFPNFECTQGPSFEELCRFAPGPSDYRTKNNLAAESLIQLVEPTSDVKGGKVASQAALKVYLDSAPKKFQKGGADKFLTEPEELARRSYDAMNLILRDVCDRERWEDQKFQDRLNTYNKDLCESLEEQLLLIENIKGLVPALSSTLHALYTTYETGKSAANFASFLSNRGKDIHESQIGANKKLVEVAQHLLQGVSQKSAVIKKGIDEGGWIDKVLESVLQGPSSDGTTVLGGLKDMVDEAHLEIWAGDVVESWKDSIIGLSYLKA